MERSDSEWMCVRTGGARGQQVRIEGKGIGGVIHTFQTSNRKDLKLLQCNLHIRWTIVADMHVIRPHNRQRDISLVHSQIEPEWIPRRLSLHASLTGSSSSHLGAGRACHWRRRWCFVCYAIHRVRLYVVVQRKYA